jgi:hypothetical protein
MMELSEKYKRDIDSIHSMFFEVSCDREKLVKLLEGRKIEKWKTLEDLAVREGQDSMSYQHVSEYKT